MRGVKSSAPSSPQASSYAPLLVPLVVRAGVPTRIPEVTKGDRLSPGIMFLLVVMWTDSSTASASFPLISTESVLSRTKWLSVPARNNLYAFFLKLGGKSLGVLDHLRLVVLKLWMKRLMKGHRLGGDDML